MRYMDIDLYVIKSDIAFITNAILTQLHVVFDTLPMAIDFPNYKENEPNSTTELNSKILFANSGNKIRLFTQDASLSREQVIDVLDLKRLIAADKIEVSDLKPVPVSTSLVMYYRDRTIDQMKAKEKKLRAVRSQAVKEFKSDAFLEGAKRNASAKEQELRAALDLMAKTSIGSAHTRINVNRESLSTDKAFSMHLIREVVEGTGSASTSFENLTSYGVSKGKNSAVYLPRF